MKKTLAALVGAGVVLLAAACGSSDDASDSATDTTSTSAAASTGTESDGTVTTTVELGKSYEENCEALLPYLDQLEGWGQDRVEAAAAVAEAQQQLPEWANLSEEQQADTLRAIDNAGKGQC
ncbi:MAG: hypothetical protein GXY65_16940 [Rhodococcus sp.]|uniref:hypothetical protein n=1 Tax=Rhodococcus TaxID=1827 RepID=UPI0016AE4EFA|nr:MULTISPECIES: hypothetical protein [Rhodococcus]NLV80991.1 hypothetical protein [Rhodococcus sp. (in: high G+C Gram-positive bacteria)]